MLNKIFHLHKQYKIDFALKTLISVFLLCTVGPIMIEMKGQLPLTMQSLVVLFVAIGFGWQIGLTSVLLYLVLGAIGLPVFASYRGGYEAFFGIYGGFFFGFVAAAVVSGYCAELEAFSKPIPAILNWFIGHFIILLFGTLWMKQLIPDSWMQKVKDVLPGAVIKSIIGALIIQLITRFFNRKKKVAFQD